MHAWLAKMRLLIPNERARCVHLLRANDLSEAFATQETAWFQGIKSNAKRTGEPKWESVTFKGMLATHVAVTGETTKTNETLAFLELPLRRATEYVHVALPTHVCALH